MTDEELQIVADNCRDMITLLVPNCKNLSNLSIVGERALAHRCKYLERISFEGCDQLSDKALLAFAKEAAEMRAINFARCPKLTDDGFIPLIESCKYLRDITLAGCELVSTASRGWDTAFRCSCFFC